MLRRPPNSRRTTTVCPAPTLFGSSSEVRCREGRNDVARERGHAVAAIDRAGCRDKDDVLDRFAAALHFPDWFGRNCDALADCLGDLSWSPAEGSLLLLHHAGAWRAAETDQFTTLLELLDAASRPSAAPRAPVWDLVPPPAPALDGVVEPALTPALTRPDTPAPPPKG